MANYQILHSMVGAYRQGEIVTDGAFGSEQNVNRLVELGAIAEVNEPTTRYDLPLVKPAAPVQVQPALSERQEWALQQLASLDLDRLARFLDEQDSQNQSLLPVVTPPNDPKIKVK